ncbi:hypothetical protein MAIT1_03756 [Magnetofaba australis IT-1]|uniref:VOC domain-containing protein n=2 Tax=Magnetofaba TaxID=1472292 RepID=A0A1Y2K3M7_9PROT|nr:hypothetical protein MAIT1_03756 [Magnetofaba australis IT-1]
MAPSLLVRNAPLSAAFYAEAFGFEAVAARHADGKPVWALLRGDGAQVILQDQARAAAQSAAQVGALWLCVADTAALHAQLLRRGLEPSPMGTLAAWEAPGFTLSDPDGHIWTIVEQSE